MIPKSVVTMISAMLSGLNADVRAGDVVPIVLSFAGVEEHQAYWIRVYRIHFLFVF